MQKEPDSLPDDIEKLKVLVIEQAVQNKNLSLKNNKLHNENLQYKTQVLGLQEQLNLAIARRYAASSEKISPDQVRLFDEADSDLSTHQTDIGDSPSEDSIVVPAHTRKKSGRKPLPGTLPRLDVVYELLESERVCPYDGNVLQEMSDVISEQLDIIPARIQVIRHIQKQYVCSCGECIKLAPKPAQPIPKSMASPGLLAHVTVSKYQDALPLYRQEKILQRIGVDIPRATLSNWMIKAGELIQSVINLMRDQLLSHDVIQMDETTVQVLNEDGKKAQSKSYLWVQRGGPPDRPVILFDYDPGRGSSVPTRLLEGFKGYLQTDGYDAYNAVVNNNKLIHLGCMAHVRRKFMDALKAQGNKKKKTSLAQQGLTLIQQLYRIEKEAKAFSVEKRYDCRVEKAKPLFEKLRVWLDKNITQIPPTSATGKAFHYLANEWDKLIAYLKDGRLNIDNNLAENAIRPFVIGRKNWLFSHSVKGVKASANLYSLIETAKGNGLEPYVYLRYLYTELPKVETVEQIEALLPTRVTQDQIKIT